MQIEIQVSFFGAARDRAGTRSTTIQLYEVDASWSGFLQALQALMAGHFDGTILIEGESGLTLASGYTLMVNKRIISIEDASDIHLNDGDEIGILPPFAGG